MVTLLRLQADLPDVLTEVHSKTNFAEENRGLDFKSVLKLQSWYRGMKVRQYFKFLNYCSLIVQRAFRGYRGRKRFRKILAQQVELNRQKHYHDKATLLQKCWRGFYIRKYIFNYYARKCYLSGLVIKNEEVRSELAQLDADIKAREMDRANEKQFQSEYQWARKSHFLVSTAIQPSIYNSPYNFDEKSRQETLLKTIKPRTPPLMKPISERYEDRTAKSYSERVTSGVLPPIKAKPQGPFRDPAEVQQQRYRPFEPSLRTETDYYSIDLARCQQMGDEKVGRIVDAKFVPFQRAPKRYEKELWSTSEYGRPPYGTVVFRETAVSGRAANSFTTVVPPIPVFEKFNQTYSQGQV